MDGHVIWDVGSFESGASFVSRLVSQCHFTFFKHFLLKTEEELYSIYIVFYSSFHIRLCVSCIQKDILCVLHLIFSQSIYFANLWCLVQSFSRSEGWTMLIFAAIGKSLSISKQTHFTAFMNLVERLVPYLEGLLISSRGVLCLMACST